MIRVDSFLLPYVIESILIDILSLLEANDVEAKYDEGQGSVDLSTFEGHKMPAGTEDKHQSCCSIYAIING